MYMEKLLTRHLANFLGKGIPSQVNRENKG